MARSYKIKSYKRIYRRSISSIILRWVLTLGAIALVLFLGWKLYQPLSSWLADFELPSLPTFEQQKQPEDETPPPVSEPAQKEEQPQTPAVTPPVEKPKEEIILEVTTPAKKTAYFKEETVMDSELFTEAIEAAKVSGMDSVMFDLKDRDGWLLYPIQYKEGFDDYYTGHTIDL